MTNKQRIKKLQKQNDSLRQRLFEVRGHLGIANKTVHDLMDLSDMKERHTQIAEKALEREWVIREYLEKRQTELILAIGDAE